MKQKPHLTLGVRIAQAFLLLLGLLLSAIAVMALGMRPISWAGVAPFLLAPALCFGVVIALNQGIGLEDRRGSSAQEAGPLAEMEESPPDLTVWPPSPRRRQ